MWDLPKVTPLVSGSLQDPCSSQTCALLSWPVFQVWGHSWDQGRIAPVLKQFTLQQRESQRKQ